jgi:Ni/Co efflux regulator RcnB
MKRPVTLVLVASLLISGSALAAGNVVREKMVAAAVRSSDAKPGNDRGHDNRGHDNRGGNSQRGNDRGRDNRGNDHRNDHRNDGGKDRGKDGRHDYDGRRDSDRRDGNDHRNDNRNNWNGHRGWDRPRNDWNKHPNYWDNRRHDRRDYARYRYNHGHYRAPHGYHYRTWHRGDHLPRAYYSSSYIVYDWRPYRLYAPPYGYHWVRVGNDVLLTALATGVVLDVLYNIWY